MQPWEKMRSLCFQRRPVALEGLGDRKLLVCCPSSPFISNFEGFSPHFIEANSKILSYLLLRSFTLAGINQRGESQGYKGNNGIMCLYSLLLVLFGCLHPASLAIEISLEAVCKINNITQVTTSFFFSFPKAVRWHR